MDVFVGLLDANASQWKVFDGLQDQQDGQIEGLDPSHNSLRDRCPGGAVSL